MREWKRFIILFSALPGDFDLIRRNLPMPAT